MARGEAGDVGGFEKAAGEEAADEEAGGVGGIYEAAGEDVAGEEAGGVGGFEEAAGLRSGEEAGGVGGFAEAAGPPSGAGEREGRGDEQGWIDCARRPAGGLGRELHPPPYH